MVLDPAEPDEPGVVVVVDVAVVVDDDDVPPSRATSGSHFGSAPGLQYAFPGFPSSCDGQICCYSIFAPRSLLALSVPQQ
eukprot:m.74363 g.74363  ORF g.74363 m.74363 type:complete len:80 (-) comp8052_c2_seq1:768-1007(-)